MLSFDEIVKRRYSARSYEPRPVAPEHILAMAEAARLAPSACNSQTWRFIAVTDRAVIERICTEGMRPVVRNAWMREAPLIFVGCAQIHLATPKSILANRIGTAITGIEYYQIDFGIAMEHLVLKATDLGLDTCWVGWFKEDAVKAILGVPRRVRVMALLAVGYGASEPPDQRPRKPLDAILFANAWGAPFHATQGEPGE